MNEILSSFVNAGIAGAALTLAVWLAMSIAPRRALNAATRYAVWWIALLVVVTLPVFYLPHRAERVAQFLPAVPTTGQTVTLVSAETTPVVSDAPSPSR